METGVWVEDKHDTFIFFNSAMEQISGLTKKQVLGTNLLRDISDETMDVEAQFRELYLHAKQIHEPT